MMTYSALVGWTSGPLVEPARLLEGALNGGRRRRAERRGP